MMDDQILERFKAAAATELRRAAWEGLAEQVTSQAYINSCTLRSARLGVGLVFFRGTGRFLPLEERQNPDYDQFWNLSVWCYGPRGEFAPFNERMAMDWVRRFFSPHERLVCSFKPNGGLSRQLQIRHYRLFVEPDFRTPKVPRGEVHSLVFG